MSGLTVATAKLIDLLTGALHTAGSSGVYLTCHRAPYLEEPSDVDLLAASSSTGHVVGHSWIPVDGNLTAAVWPVGNTVTALGVLKRLSKKAENHTVDIDMVRADPPENLKEGEHPGWIVSITESAALFDSDTAHQFHAHDESRFPARGVARVLHGVVAADEEFVESPLTVWSAGDLGALVKVAKANGGSIRMFRSAVSRLHVVQIGPKWLGAAYSVEASAGTPTDGPSIESLFPLPDEPAEAPAANAKRRGKESAKQSTIEDVSPEDANDPPVTTDPVEQQRQAVELVVKAGMASPSMLNRKLKVGHHRALVLLEELEDAGIVGPAVGSAARDVNYKPADLAHALTALSALSKSSGK